MADDDEPAELDTGSKVGVGIGVAAIGVSVLVAIFIGTQRLRNFYRGKKQRSTDDFDNQQSNDKASEPPPPPEPAMLDAEPTKRNSAWSNPKSELPGSPTDGINATTVSQSTSSSMQKEENTIVYKPFRYQGAELGGISELSEHPAPVWSYNTYRSYRPEQSSGANDFRANANAGSNGGSNIYELPASEEAKS